MQYADTAYLNGLLYTGDAQRRFAQALATRDGKIVAVGRETISVHSSAPRRAPSTWPAG